MLKEIKSLIFFSKRKTAPLVKSVSLLAIVLGGLYTASGCISGDGTTRPNDPPLVPYGEPYFQKVERTNSKETLNKPYVIMISIDGFRYDYLDKYQPPFLSSLASKGTRAKSMTPIYPSLTFPNHISLVTGRYSENHGIVGNNFYDSKRNANYEMRNGATVNDKSWYSGEPLWAAAERNGMISAVCFWVGSEADIDGVSPTFVRPYEDALPHDERIEQVMRWLRLPDAQRPHFVGLYFSKVDSMGHANGPDSSEVRDAILDVDKHLEQLYNQVAALGLKNVNYVIVSDHGMELVNPDGLIIVNDVDDPSIRGLFSRWKTAEQGALSSLFLADEKLSSADAKIEIDQMYSKLKALPSAANYTVYKRNEIPKDWHYSHPHRVGDILLVANTGYYLKFHNFLIQNEPSRKTSFATHGWPTELTSMGALFIAQGEQIQSGKVIPAFKNINVYPLVLELLNIKASKPYDGDLNVLKPILRN